MKEEDFYKQIIETADVYHVTAEEQWAKAVELEPTNQETSFEFRRLVNVAMRFYTRAYLMLNLAETDDDQELADLLEWAGEEMPELARLIDENNAQHTLDEDSEEPLSRVFSVAEVLRSLLLQQSSQLAATLHKVKE